MKVEIQTTPKAIVYHIDISNLQTNLAYEGSRDPKSMHLLHREIARQMGRDVEKKILAAIERKTGAPDVEQLLGLLTSDNSE